MQKKVNKIAEKQRRKIITNLSSSASTSKQFKNPFKRKLEVVKSDSDMELDEKDFN